MLGLDEQTIERRSLARNEALFRQGEKVSAIYFVETGRLRLERRTFDGRLLILGITGFKQLTRKCRRKRSSSLVDGGHCGLPCSFSTVCLVDSVASNLMDVEYPLGVVCECSVPCRCSENTVASTYRVAIISYASN